MYLSKIFIRNFRGIKELLVEFDKKLNVIIGANGQLKTSLMDAIRLFYAWGEPNRDIEITKEDFHVEITQNDDGTKTIEQSTKIDICYQFEGLSAQQEGAFYQYLDKKDDGTMIARVHLSFEMKEKREDIFLIHNRQRRERSSCRLEYVSFFSSLLFGCIT